MSEDESERPDHALEDDPMKIVVIDDKFHDHSVYDVLLDPSTEVEDKLRDAFEIFTSTVFSTHTVDTSVDMANPSSTISQVTKMKRGETSKEKGGFFSSAQWGNSGFFQRAVIAFRSVQVNREHDSRIVCRESFHVPLPFVVQCSLKGDAYDPSMFVIPALEPIVQALKRSSTMWDIMTQRMMFKDEPRELLKSRLSDLTVDDPSPSEPSTGDSLFNLGTVLIDLYELIYEIMVIPSKTTVSSFIDSCDIALMRKSAAKSDFETFKRLMESHGETEVTPLFVPAGFQDHFLFGPNSFNLRHNPLTSLTAMFFARVNAALNLTATVFVTLILSRFKAAALRIQEASMDVFEDTLSMELLYDSTLMGLVFSDLRAEVIQLMAFSRKQQLKESFFSVSKTAFYASRDENRPAFDDTVLEISKRAHPDRFLPLRAAIFALEGNFIGYLFPSLRGLEVLPENTPLAMCESAFVWMFAFDEIVKKIDFSEMFMYRQFETSSSNESFENDNDEVSLIFSDVTLKGITSDVLLRKTMSNGDTILPPKNIFGCFSNITTTSVRRESFPHAFGQRSCEKRLCRVKSDPSRKKGLKWAKSILHGFSPFSSFRRQIARLDKNKRKFIIERV